jgi:FkbM family methyltransferase
VKIIESAKRHYALFGLRGLARRTTASVFERFRAKIPGSKRQVIIRLGTTDVAAFEHVFIDNEYDFDLGRSPKFIIDAGANVGLASVFFALKYPTANIIAVEPEPSNFAILKKNAKLFPQIVPLQAALWNRDGFVDLKDGGAGHWGMQVTQGDSIAAISMPTLLRLFNIQEVDVLKIDVEGAEVELFSDTKWIDCVSMICIELHDRFRKGCETAFEETTGEFPKRWRRGELRCVARA